MDNTASPANLASFRNHLLTLSQARNDTGIGLDARLVLGMAPKARNPGDCKRALIEAMRKGKYDVEEGKRMRERIERLYDSWTGPVSCIVDTSPVGGWVPIGEGCHMRQTHRTAIR